MARLSEEQRRLVRFYAANCFLLFLALSPGALAQTVDVRMASPKNQVEARNDPPTARPERSVSRYDDWELICDVPNAANEQAPERKQVNAPELKASHCRAMQRQAVKGTGETVFLASILPAAQRGKQVMIISTPLGGYLAPGMELLIEKKRRVRVLYETCNSDGCHGGFGLVGMIRQELMRAKTLAVRLWTARNEPVNVNVSMNGFDKVLRALDAKTR
jgi:invasion protein IalB